MHTKWHSSGSLGEQAIPRPNIMRGGEREERKKMREEAEKLKFSKGGKGEGAAKQIQRKKRKKITLIIRKLNLGLTNNTAFFSPPL